MASAQVQQEPRQQLHRQHLQQLLQRHLRLLCHIQIQQEEEQRILELSRHHSNLLWQLLNAEQQALPLS